MPLGMSLNCGVVGGSNLPKYVLIVMGASLEHTSGELLRKSRERSKSQVERSDCGGPQNIDEIRRAYEHRKTLLAPVETARAEDLDAESETTIETDHRG